MCFRTVPLIFFFMLQHSWYFFEALVKSMANYLIECGKVRVGYF